jgi:pimeloyl-ACP methyl ester carboxylesterase
LRPHRQILVAAAALSLWLGRPANSIAAAESQFFDAKGVKIHFLIEGTGEPVVLIHGLDSSARVNWQMPGTIDALAKDHQVIAIDLPGYGESDKPADPAAYGEQWVDDVILLLNHLNIRKAHIVGYSMGGMVALKLIAEHPERVISGTLGGAGWLREDSILQKIWTHMRTTGARSIPEVALTADQLKAIRIPVEILVGDRDPMKKLYVEPLESVRSDWRVIEIEGAGHLNCIFKKQFIDEIEKWLDMNRLK